MIVDLMMKLVWQSGAAVVQLATHVRTVGLQAHLDWMFVVQQSF